MTWGGKRPYRQRVRKFLDWKLGKYNGYHIQFHFLSTNNGKRHYGLSKKVALILENA